MDSRFFQYCPVDGRRFIDGELICAACGTERDLNRFLDAAKLSGSPLFAAPYANLNESEQSGRRPWRKLLYIKQDYPDNYVDHTFLEEMQKNANVRSYDYLDTVRESSVITQQLSSIIIFVAVFIHIYASKLHVHYLIVFGGALTAMGYVYWYTHFGSKDPSFRHTKLATIKATLLFFTTLLGLSPILKTLTQDTSDDTIWALTVCFFLINLLFHDYGSANITTITFPGSFATNAAIFASVLLASRLPSNIHVFGLMLFAVEWFALFPIFRRSIKRLSMTLTLVISAVLIITSVFLLSTISKAVAVIYTTVVLFVTFVCPFWLIWIQRYKNEIHGPWDEATLKLHSSK